MLSLLELLKSLQCDRALGGNALNRSKGKINRIIYQNRTKTDSIKGIPILREHLPYSTFVRQDLYCSRNPNPPVIYYLIHPSTLLYNYKFAACLQMFVGVV